MSFFRLAADVSRKGRLAIVVMLASVVAAGVVASVAADPNFRVPFLIVTSPGTVPEGTGGLTPAVFNLDLSNPSDQPASADWYTFSIGHPWHGNLQRWRATADVDYLSASGTVTFQPGETHKTITTWVIGDSIFDTQDCMGEGYELDFKNFQNIHPIPAEGFQYAVIQDDDIPALSIADVTVTETTGQQTRARFTVSLSAPNTAPGGLVFDWHTVDGTATAPDDYVATSGEVAFNTGDQQKVISVPVNGDALPESTETFSVVLDTSGTCLTVAKNTGTATIIDND
jgi:Calx-beta domain